jgi:hypothetical protein
MKGKATYAVCSPISEVQQHELAQSQCCAKAEGLLFQKLTEINGIQAPS